MSRRLEVDLGCNADCFSEAYVIQIPHFSSHLVLVL
jgi:hypothetical protein